jgi:hypothetical protein
LVANPPKYWDELYALTSKISTHDSSSDILQSTVAFGEWDNVTNAKEILSLLLLQAGTPIVNYDNQQKKYTSVLDAVRSTSRSLRPSLL